MARNLGKLAFRIGLELKGPLLSHGKRLKILPFLFVWGWLYCLDYENWLRASEGSKVSLCSSMCTNLVTASLV